MDYRFTDEEEAFRREVRDFFLSVLPSDWLGVDQDMNNQNHIEEIYRLGLDIRKKLGEKGWLEISWPPEYGGLGASPTKQMILEEELYYLGVPGYDQPTFGVCGPVVYQMGTEEQKRRFLLPIARGEVKWVVGLSEPGAGSEVSNLQLRAEEDGDCFVLNGQKSWQSGGHMGDWAIVCARTDSNPPKHRGITAFIVDLTSPGITIREVAFVSGVTACTEVFYENVRVPGENMLRTKNDGWPVATLIFARDRFCGFQEILRGRRDFEWLLEYCREAEVNGRPVARDPLIRNKLAEVATALEVGYDLGRRMTWMVARDMDVAAEACQLKVLGAETLQHLADVGMQILGSYGPLGEDSRWVKLRGRWSHNYLCRPGWTIGGGTSEISKNFVAAARLGLPRG